MEIRGDLKRDKGFFGCPPPPHPFPRWLGLFDHLCRSLCAPGDNSSYSPSPSPLPRLLQTRGGRRCFCWPGHGGQRLPAFVLCLGDGQWRALCQRWTPQLGL